MNLCKTATVGFEFTQNNMSCVGDCVSTVSPDSTPHSPQGDHSLGRDFSLLHNNLNQPGSR